MLTHLQDQAQSLTDLAADLTDHALEIVGGAGSRGDSVELELKLWRTLTAELKQELRGRHILPRLDSAPLHGALKRVVYRAALRVIAERSRVSESRTPRAERAAGQLCPV